MTSSTALFRMLIMGLAFLSNSGEAFSVRPLLQNHGSVPVDASRLSWRPRRGELQPASDWRATTLKLTRYPAILATASCWTFSAALGFLAEEHCKADSGILVTMLVSALLSATILPGSGPATDMLSTMCWNTLLPASLALLLLSLDGTRATQPKSSNNIPRNDNEMSMSQSIQQLTIPFVLACLGSILGCIIAFGLCLSEPLQPFLSSCLLAPKDAQIALSCLAASFVGGSVNFFATAKTIQNMAPKDMTSTIVSSMAATDILVMAIYFALMGSALSSKRLKEWFDRPSMNRKGRSSDQPEQSELFNATVVDGSETRIPASLRRSSRGIGTAALVAWGIVNAANHIESKLPNVLPGLACAVIASCTPVVKQLLQAVLGKTTQCSWYQDMQRFSVILSKLCFLMLFSSIGSTADLKAAVRSGPACLILSLLALSIHFATTIVASLLFSRCFQKRKSPLFGIDLESVLVASNAAIGGPSTAAAFCGRIKGRQSVEGITYAATVWGIVGYATGTTIGVLLHRLFGLTTGLWPTS
mmetsp:Transcript_2206/g.4456  ORF Transcript_2206/g.4456 Transcript_2206/m.4456 type:complete len:531 (+) Transcript_2206:124-1716(+)